MNRRIPIRIVGHPELLRSPRFRDQAADDPRRDVVSLRRLIERVQSRPTVLSRERYTSQTSAFQDRDEAERIFTSMIGPGSNHADREMARADLEQLRHGTEGIVTWVNTEVAHYSEARTEFAVDPTLGDLDRAVDVVIDLFLKYRDLILGSSMTRFIAMPSWTRIFRVNWIPDRDHERQIGREILALQQRDRVGFDWAT